MPRGSTTPAKPFGVQTAKDKKFIMRVLSGAASARFRRKIGKG